MSMLGDLSDVDAAHTAYSAHPVARAEAALYSDEAASVTGELLGLLGRAACSFNPRRVREESRSSSSLCAPSLRSGVLPGSATVGEASVDWRSNAPSARPLCALGRARSHARPTSACGARGPDAWGAERARAAWEAQRPPPPPGPGLWDSLTQLFCCGESRVQGRLPAEPDQWAQGHGAHVATPMASHRWSDWGGQGSSAELSRGASGGPMPFGRHIPESPSRAGGHVPRSPSRASDRGALTLAARTQQGALQLPERLNSGHTVGTGGATDHTVLLANSSHSIDSPRTRTEWPRTEGGRTEGSTLSIDRDPANIYRGNKYIKGDVPRNNVFYDARIRAAQRNFGEIPPLRPSPLVADSKCSEPSIGGRTHSGTATPAELFAAECKSNPWDLVASGSGKAHLGRVSTASDIHTGIVDAKASDVNTSVSVTKASETRPSDATTKVSPARPSVPVTKVTTSGRKMSSRAAADVRTGASRQKHPDLLLQDGDWARRQQGRTTPSSGSGSTDHTKAALSSVSIAELFD